MSKNIFQKGTTWFDNLHPNIKSGLKAGAGVTAAVLGINAVANYAPKLQLLGTTSKFKKKISKQLANNKRIQWPLYALVAYTLAGSGRKGWPKVPLIGDLLDNINMFKPKEYESNGKEASSGLSDFLSSTVPVKSSMNTIAMDPFMTNTEKTKTNSLIFSSDTDNSGTGLLSGRDLASTAFKAGSHGGSAYLFGKTMGTLFGLPKPITNRLSEIGGVASAIRSTGIFK